MEINEAVLSMIERTNPGDFAVYRAEKGAVRALLLSPDLPRLSDMTREEYRALTDGDALAAVLEPDRPLVEARLAELLRDPEDNRSLTLTCRIRHKTRGFVWMRSKLCRIGESEGFPVVMISFATSDSASAEYAELLDHTGISVYVIDKKTYELLYVNGPALSASGGRSYEGTQCYRFFNGLSAPCPWCSLPFMKDGHAHVEENYVPPLDRWYRHDVQDIDWYGRTAAAFYIANITEQKQRQARVEERFHNLYRQISKANPDALAMFRLNLTQNTCTDGQSKYDAALRQQNAGTVDGYLAACAEIITDEQIRRECLARFTLPNLLREFQNGVTEVSLEYPIRSSAGDLIWVNGTISMMQNPANGDVEGIAYAVNITDRKINESIIARIAEEKYDHIGLINVAARTYELWKADEAYDSLDAHRRVDYDAAFRDVLAHFVSPEDRALFVEHGELKNMIDRLNRTGSDTYVFRCPGEDGDLIYKQVKYTWLSDDRELILESQTDVTELYRQQLEQVKRQHEAELLKERALNAEAIPSGIGVFDVTGDEVCINYLNDGFYRMIGAPREEREQYQDAMTLKAVHPEDRAAIYEETQACIRQKRQFRCRYRLLDGSGRYRWVELLANHTALNERTERFYAAYYDVDELLRTQKELQEKELVFKDILAYSDLLHFTYYPGRRRYEAAILPARLSKIPKAMDDYPDSFIRYIGLSETDAEAYRQMVRAIDGGAPEAECTVRMNYEGKSGWYRVHMLSMLDGNGRTQKAIGNVFNVDRNVTAEKAIADEKLRMESLRGLYLATACFNVTRDVEITFNSGREFTRQAQVDQTALAEAMAIEPGVEKQAPETLSVLLSAAGQISDGGQRAEFIRACSHLGMLRLFQEGRRDVTLEYRRSLSGRMAWVATRMILMAEPSSGDVLAFYYSRDISREKKSEQIIHHLMQEGFDYIGILYLTDRTFEFVRKNPRIRFPEVNQRTDYEACRKYVSAHFVESRERLQFEAATGLDGITAALEKNGRYDAFYSRSENGAVSRCELQYSWLDRANGEILVIRSNITDAYQAEQKRLSELHDALQQAKMANNAKNDFISRISHDIRTPIGAITNMTAFAFEDLDDREKLEDDLRKIQASNTFLLSLINDVLDISKVDSGKIELRPELYRYEDFISNIRNMFGPLCQEKKLRLDVEDAPRPAVIRVDPTRFNQIAMNLLSNAVKYTPEGGRIAIRASGTRRPDGRYGCELRISDTGIGMDGEFQKTMFEPFTQEYDNPLRDKALTGTGLGLSIVKRLVDLMDGSIDVESGRGKGTTVAVRFVTDGAEKPEDDAAGRPDQSGTEEGRRLEGTVLLAEDNDINAQIAARILGSFGLTAERAENGKQAAERFAASRPGTYRAVLMDIQMPVMNGYEATRAIRALDRPDAGTVPIVAMTADAFQDAVDRARRAGMSDYVTKPLEPAVLRAILEKYW